MAARTANLYRVLRLDDEGFWTDMPGGNDFHNMEDAKIEARHYHQKSNQRSKVVDAQGDCKWDSKFDDELGQAIKEALGS